MVAEAIALKNVLMVYSGGGYDGCIWESNWCLWDKDGQWHDVYSSGCGALKTEEAALEQYRFWDTEEEKSEVMHVINLDKEDDFNCLQSYETVMLEALLRTVNEKLAELGQPMVAWFTCGTCGKKHYPWSEEPGHPEGLKGNGGVGYVGNELLCPECYHGHCCPYCGEYDEDAHKYGGYCQFCHEKALNHFLKTLVVGSIEWEKRYVDYKGKKEWVASDATVTEPDDFDPKWFEIEAQDFKKPEKMDPDTEYLWVVESSGVDYFIRARTADEAGSDCRSFLGSCDDVTAAWEAFEFNVADEHDAARKEEQQEAWEKQQKRDILFKKIARLERRCKAYEKLLTLDSPRVKKYADRLLNTRLRINELREQIQY